jgi:hypothetical protein
MRPLCCSATTLFFLAHSPSLPSVRWVSHGQSVAVEKLISELDNKLTLLNLVVKDFTRYNQKVKGARGAAAAHNAHSADPSFLGRHPHSRELSTRLEFLEYILTHAAFVLSREHVDAMWDVFVTNAALATADPPRLFKWLDKCVSEVDDKKQGTANALQRPATPCNALQRNATRTIPNAVWGVGRRFPSVR